MTRKLIAWVLSASAVSGQPVYEGVPEWVSSDTPISTGAALVDLDRDGWLDFVVANGNDMRRESIAVYYNNGFGQYPAYPGWLSNDVEYNGHLDVADVNGDGWLDVAVGLTTTDTGTPSARLYLNNGGVLSSTPDWESDVAVAAFHVAFGDVNADGRPDLAVGTGWPYSASQTWHNHVYMNIGGVLEDVPSWTSDDTRDYSDVLFCDINADGWLDLIGVGTGTATWAYLNDGGMLATTATWHTTDNPSQFSVMATVGDVDADGWVDLFVTDNYQIISSQGFQRRYNGLVGGFFETSPSWAYRHCYGSAVALADVDADGDLDLASGAWWRPTHYFTNEGGALGDLPAWSSSGSSVVESLVFGDVDRDGIRRPVAEFDVSGMSGQHLFAVGRQPIETIVRVVVDGRTLQPDEYTFRTLHGWVSIGPVAEHTVRIEYEYSLKPDLAVTNWDDSRGNCLYYNHNAAPRLGDLNGDGTIGATDVPLLMGCFSGPGNTAPAECAAGDDDLDGDIDLRDVAAFSLVVDHP